MSYTARLGTRPTRNCAEENMNTVNCRIKPVVAVAVNVGELLRCARGDWKALPGWVEAAYERGEILFCPGKLYLDEQTGESGDWLVWLDDTMAIFTPEQFELRFDVVNGQEFSLAAPTEVPVAEPSWVNAKKKKPKANEEVYIFDTYYHGVTDGLWTGNWWQTTCGSDDIGVSHWMPKDYPAPPPGK